MTDLEQTCTACEGSGVAAAPAWTAYARKVHDITNLYADHIGLETWEERVMLAERLGVKPPAGFTETMVEAPCAICTGSGKVPTEEGHKLLDFIRRHL